jgi:creatinine amidohydrolase
MFDLEVIYERLTPSEFKTRLQKAPIAYLPLGTLEWHGAHLPLGSDFLQPIGLFKELAQRVGGIILPPLFLGPDKAQDVDGFEYYGMDWHVLNPPQQLAGSAYWASYELFSALLEALLKQLRRAGFRIVVAHGHGPSTDYIIDNREELSRKHDLAIFTVWPDEEREQDLEFQCDHAAMNETSIMMALHPDLVHMENLPTASDEWPLAIAGKDPRKYASAELGEKIIRSQLERMERVLKDQLLSLHECVRTMA